jgi:hypothetical protein
LHAGDAVSDNFSALHGTGNCAAQTTHDNQVVCLEGYERALDDGAERLRGRNADFVCGSFCCRHGFSFLLEIQLRLFGEGRVGFECYSDRDHGWKDIEGNPGCWWDDGMHGHAMCGWEEACFIADVLLRRRLPC